MTVIYVKNYSNYSDRKIKHSPHEYFALTFQYLTDYETTSRTNVNFDFKDGIETEITVEWSESWNPNYLFACGNESSDTNPISSWFIMEFTKIRGRQYRARLKRDVVNDYYENIMEAPSYIEKGILPIDNDLIFNNEGLTVNQIKKKETLLKDNFHGYYYIAYVTKEAAGEITGTTSDFPYITVSSANNEYLKGATIHATATEKKFYFPQFYMVEFYLSDSDTKQKYTVEVYYDGSGNNIYVALNPSVPQFQGTRPIIGFENKKDLFVKELLQVLTSDIAYGYDIVYGDAVTKFAGTYDYVKGTMFETLKSYNGKTILDNWIYEGETNEEYYNYSMATLENNVNSSSQYVNASTSAYFLQKLFTALNNLGLSHTSETQTFKIKTVNVSLYNFNRSLYTPSAIFSINITTDRKHCEDAPYDIIIIPVGIEKVASGSTTGGLPLFTQIDDSLQIAFAEKLNKEWASGSSPKLIDMQRVPYAPYLNEDYIIKMGGEKQISTRTMVTRKKGLFDMDTGLICMFATSKQLTFNIELNKSIELDANEFKFSNDCEFMRLVSPNGSGAFDFNIAKNGGTIDYINVDCTFKPGQPYIHLNPNFNRLYATDYNDYRGLICGGDFSVPTMTNSWLSYINDNKLFNKIFDRQVQNLDVNQSLSLKQELFYTGMGTVGGIVGGALKGSSGGVAGGIVGGVMGGVVPATTGISRNVFMQESQKEARSYLIDQYNLNLRNIQARQDTLTKVGADDFNNKIWCVLEEYSCSEIEKEAYLNKIKYNGMTVNCIGKIKDYVYNSNISYIQARIIMIDDLSEDDHLITTIKNEIAMGVYLKGE